MRLASIVLAAALTASPFVVSAQSTNTSGLIANLLAQVAVLQQKIAALTQQGNPTPASCQITRTLALGARGDDVRCLQQYLITQNLLTPDSATGYYGRLTQSAVKRFQRSHNLESVGWVGRLTRALINTTSTNSGGSTLPLPSIPNPITPPVVPPGSGGGGGSLSCTPETAQTKSIACPSGQTGTITQTRTSSCPGPVWSDWQTTGNSCTTAIIPPTSCTFNGQSVANGQSVTAYQSSSVAYGSACASETRTCTKGTLSGSYQNTSCSVANLGQLIVGPSSHVVVMEYETWFNPLWNASGQVFGYYEPLLKSSNVSQGYDSSDPLIIDQHVKWLTALGVDAVIDEQSNGGPCAYGDAQMCAQFLGNQSSVVGYTAIINAINQGAFNLYPAFEARGAAIKIIPMVDGQDALMYQPRGDGQTPFDVQIGAYHQRVAQYPDLSVIYHGKPLLLVFVGASVNTSDPNSVYNQAQTAIQKWQDRFTIRLMAGFIDSQTLLWDKLGIGNTREVDPRYQTWTWIDRYNPTFNLMPSYTTAGSRAEAFTVTSAANGADPINRFWGPDATLYHGGDTYKSFFDLAVQLDPIFLIFNQFNEFAGPGASVSDEGPDIEHSNDIEPTKQWGTAKFDVAKQYLQAYRAGSINPVRVSPKESFITGLYQCILGRTPNSTEIAQWLTSTSTTPISAFYGEFFQSTGYSASATNDRYVQQLYQCVLGRTGSAPEIAPWSAALVNGRTRAAELSTFLTSTEFRENYGKLMSQQTGFPL